MNLGNASEFTIAELAEVVLRQTRSRSSVVRMPLPPDDPRQRRPDITLARRLFGYEPQVALEEGLGKTIDHFFAKLGGDRRLLTAPLAPPRAARK